jgi:hypothetical protein
MKRLTFVLAACAGALVVTVGCNRTETPPVPTATPPTNTASQATTAPQAQPPQETPSTPTAPMPPPNVPAGGDASATPKPGQANDHSSPAFKAGGKEAPK